MVTKQQFAEHHNTSRLILVPCTHTPYNPQSTRSITADSDMLTSSVVMSYTSYYLPLGRILLQYGWRSRELYGHVAYEESESLLAGQWDFNPASWVSYRGIRVQARLLVQLGECSKARITPSLTSRMCISGSHPVWECIKKGDLMGVRRHLSTGSVGVNDTTLWGETLLFAVGGGLYIAANFH